MSLGIVRLPADALTPLSGPVAAGELEHAINRIHLAWIATAAAADSRLQAADCPEV
jgi:hypothetical protein